MDDIRTTRHQQRSKRTSKSTAAANNSRSIKAEAPSQIHQRNKALQADHPTNSEASSKSNPWSQHFCGQRLSRMPSNKEIHNRICHCASWNANQLWKQNAGNNCPLKCRGRAICHQHRRNRSTSHQKPLDGASQWTSTRSTSRSTQAHQVARAWTQELEPQEKQNALNPNIFSFNNWSHTTKWDWSKFTQTTTQHIDQVCLNRDSATTPSTSWT